MSGEKISIYTQHSVATKHKVMSIASHVPINPVMHKCHNNLLNQKLPQTLDISNGISKEEHIPKR